MTNAQRLAKIANITEQQAVTMAVIIRRAMKDGITMEQAVAHYMASMKEMAAYARMDATA